MLARLDRILFCRQSKCVPSHRVEHVKTSEPFISGNDIGGGITLGMSDVQAGSARIRKHIQHVVFRFRGIEFFLARVGCVEKLFVIPNLLPFRLEFIEWVRLSALAHLDGSMITEKFIESADEKSANFENLAVAAVYDRHLSRWDETLSSRRIAFGGHRPPLQKSRCLVIRREVEDFVPRFARDSKSVST